MAERNEAVSPPKTFISYSWDDQSHKGWVRDFASRLRRDGVDATIDQWAVIPGDRLTLFMEQAVRDNSYVLIVCTPKYKEKSDARRGGVDYEGDIMTAEAYAKGNHRKFIPVLRQGDWATAIPSWLGGKYSTASTCVTSRSPKLSTKTSWPRFTTFAIKLLLWVPRQR